ncbi:transposase [Rugosimonospora africana]|nr:transposase [Rugosimonospora africana]
MLLFLDRPIALPVLARLRRTGGPAQTVLARELIEVIATHTRSRTMHVVADGTYLCTVLRRLPAHATLTGPLHSNASLWHTHPDLDHPTRRRGRGRPRTYAARIGHPRRPGRHDTLHLCHRNPLRTHRHSHGAPAAAPVARRFRRPTGPDAGLLVLTEPRKPELALVTTDLAAPIAAIVECYAGRWSIEVAFEDAKQTTGVGEARNDLATDGFADAATPQTTPRGGHHPAHARPPAAA